MNIKIKDKEIYIKKEELINQFEFDNYKIDTIIELEISYDGKDWDRIKEIVCPTNNCRELEWLNDWWEGQRYINIIGMANIDEIDVPAI